MNNRRILIANLAKGTIGEQAANLLGSLLVSHLQLDRDGARRAAARRARPVLRARRRIPDLQLGRVRILAVRGAQIRDSTSVSRTSTPTSSRTAVRSAVIGNAGTLVVFRVGSRDAELLAPEFRPMDPGGLADQEPFTAWLRRGIGRDRIFAEPKLYEPLGTADAHPRAEPAALRPAPRCDRAPTADTCELEAFPETTMGLHSRSFHTTSDCLGAEMSGTVSALLNALVQSVLFAAAIGILLLVMIIIFRFPRLTTGAELVMRALAATCGLLFYIGAKAIGLSVPELMYKSLSAPFPISVGLAGVIAPSAIGFFVSWYVIRQLKRLDPARDALSVRVLVLVTTFVFFLYCDTYFATFGGAPSAKFVHLLPNLVFVLSVLMYAILRYDPTEIPALRAKLAQHEPSLKSDTRTADRSSLTRWPVRPRIFSFGNAMLYGLIVAAFATAALTYYLRYILQVGWYLWIPAAGAAFIVVLPIVATTMEELGSKIERSRRKEEREERKDEQRRKREEEEKEWQRRQEELRRRKQ